MLAVKAGTIQIPQAIKLMIGFYYYNAHQSILTDPNLFNKLTIALWLNYSLEAIDGVLFSRSRSIHRPLFIANIVLMGEEPVARARPLEGVCVRAARLWCAHTPCSYMYVRSVKPGMSAPPAPFTNGPAAPLP